MATNGRKSFFKTIQHFQADYCPSSFVLYESERTGMRVVVVNQKGPKVHGYFVLATEIHDDSGAPHTLEHLIFQGSKNYKYKGLLDTLANRSYSFTNAWTATDHTAYTLESAGWDGFAQLLPVYLEHVLLPSLTDSACYTEVHHIDGDGKDAGVVYSEMQARENTQADLMDIFGRRLTYPDGDGYRYETGGLMANLRVLTADRIRSFHREMYQPRNFCLGLIGEVDHDNLLNILDKFEDESLPDLPPVKAPFKRPWVESKQTLTIEKSIVDIIEFPEEDESSGEISISILGPNSKDYLLIAALNVLLTYICGSSISLLENTLVEKEQLTSMVYYTTEVRPAVVISFYLASVQTDKLEKVANRFFEVLKEHANNGIDLAYMRDCLARYKRQLKLNTENSADSFSGDIINDHLFGNRDGSDLIKVQNLKEYDTLEDWKEHQWRGFFSKYIAHANHVTILGKPSKSLSKKIAEDETARVKKQQESLGEEGLKRLQKQLDDAKAKNDCEIPTELQEKFYLPDPSSIHFIPTITARSGLAKTLGTLKTDIQDIVDKDPLDSQLYIHFEHGQTNFVHISVVLNTSAIPIELRPLLSVYISNFFDTPVMRSGKRVEFEEVVTQLERDTIGYSIDDARRLGNSELLRVRLEVEPAKYDEAISWIRDLLFNSIFDKTRLESSLAKLVADIPEEKREGSAMVHAIASMTHMSQKSSVRAQNTLVKALYLRRMRALLKTDPASVISHLETVRHSLTQPSNFRVFVLADLRSTAFPHPASAWATLTAASTWPSLPTLAPLDSRAACLSDAGRHPGRHAYIVPMPTVDSSFALLVGRGPASFTDPAVPALMVLLSYLNTTEGPMWNAVRGTGLAYGVDFSRDFVAGRLLCSVYRSPDAFKAFAATRAVVADLAAGRARIDALALEGAISAIVTGLADEQPTLSSAAAKSFANQAVLGIAKDWGVGIMGRVRAVTVEEVKEMLVRFLVPMFEPGSADLFVTCAGIMEEGLVEGFKGAGWGVEVKPLTWFQDDYGLEGEEGEDDEEDEDEDDDEDDDDDDGEDYDDEH